MPQSLEMKKEEDLDGRGEAKLASQELGRFDVIQRAKNDNAGRRLITHVNWVR